MSETEYEKNNSL